jgi:protoheme IX farnesyltransferase
VWGRRALLWPKCRDYVAIITNFAYRNPSNQGVGVKISNKMQDRISDRVDSYGGDTFVASASDYVALMKPRVMSLSVFTAFVGMVMAPATMSVVTATVAMIAIALGAGAAGALNMWYDADIDAVMSRTSGRPLPAGRISSNQALAFGITVTIVSVVLLAMVTNFLAALLLAFTIFFYAVIYTMWLKHKTPQNIVIGGAAGAIPPMIGWAAASGTVTVESIVLFLIIFFWTPPHFWALALFKSGDYETANIPMMPVVAGHTSTRRQIFAYALILAPIGVFPSIVGSSSIFYGVVAALLGIWFAWLAYLVYATGSDDPSMKPEKRLFAFSIVYLFLIFGALLSDAILFGLTTAVAG